IRRPGQATGMSGQDTFGAALHLGSSASVLYPDGANNATSAAVGGLPVSGLLSAPCQPIRHEVCWRCACGICRTVGPLPDYACTTKPMALVDTRPAGDRCRSQADERINNALRP